MSQAPYPGPAAPVLPAGGTLTVAGSNYDDGGEGVAYHDAALGIEPGASDGGRTGSDVEQDANGNITWVSTGEWLEYTIDIEAAGSYDLSFLTATQKTGRDVSVSFYRAGESSAYATTGDLTTPNTGNWDQYQATTASMTLEAGIQTVRVTFEDGQTNFRDFTLTADAGGPGPGPGPQSPYPGPAAPVLSAGGTLTVAGSDYDDGGEGVSYHDATAGIVNAPGTSDGGRTGSDVEQDANGNITWVSTGEWLEYTIDIEAAGSYDLSFLTATQKTGRDVSVSFYRAGESSAYATTGDLTTPNTGNWDQYQATTASMTLEAGIQTVRVTFEDGQTNFRDFTLTADAGGPGPGPGPQSPYPGPAAPVLSAGGTLTVAGSNYDDGGEGVSYHDATAGIVDAPGTSDGGRTGSDVEQDANGNITWVSTGEWLEYTIDIEAAGSYDLSFLTATQKTGRDVSVSFYRAGESSAYATTGDLTTPNTGNWDQYQATTASMTLEAGIQTVRVTFEDGQTNFRDFTLTADAGGPGPGPGPQSPYPGPAAPVLSAGGTLTVAGSNYDDGGEGVSYHDATAGIVDAPGTSDGGRTGSDVEQDANGNITWVSTGEWLEYTIDIEAAGSYDLSFLTATQKTGRDVSVSFYRAGESSAYATTGDLTTPNTGNWDQYQATTASMTLEAGIQTVRVTFEDGQTNFRDFTLTADAGGPGPGPGPQSPYPGPAAPVLSAGGTLTVAGADYDDGGEGVSYHDATAGIVDAPGTSDGGRIGSDVEQDANGNITWVSTGEWLEYTIDIEAAGSYDLSFLTATKKTGRDVSVSFYRAGESSAYATTGDLTTPNTGNWDQYQATTASMTLEAGIQTVRVTFEDGQTNFRDFTLTADAGGPGPGPGPQSPYPGPAAPVLSAGGTLTVAGADYDDGGEGVSYHDATAGIVDAPGTSDGGRIGSDVEQDANGNITWVSTGEWLEYTIDIEAAGSYDLSFLTATKKTGRDVSVSFYRDGEASAYATTGGLTTPNTGNWDQYQLTGTKITLEAGIQTVRVTFEDGQTNFRDFTLSADDGSTLFLAGNPKPVTVDLAANQMVDAARILPIGDSITFGEDTPGGYRALVWNDIVYDSGLWFDYVGEYTGNPADIFQDPDHQGKSGIRASAVANKIDDIAADYPADIALVLLGANDILSSKGDYTTVPNSLQTIIGTLDSANPGMQIYLGTLTAIANPAQQAQADWINTQMPGLVADLQADGIDVTLVDMSGVTTAHLQDNVHPSAAGYEIMADAWLDAIASHATVTGTTLNGTVTPVDANVVNVVGTSAGDQILGDNQANTLDGGGGDDEIVGRGGNDLLTGGGGRDLFIFASNFDDDTITDFNAGPGGDVIWFDGLGVSSFSDLAGHYSQDSSGTTFSFGSDGSVLLADLAFSSLESDNFLFYDDAIA